MPPLRKPFPMDTNNCHSSKGSEERPIWIDLPALGTARGIAAQGSCWAIILDKSRVRLDPV